MAEGSKPKKDEWLSNILHLDCYSTSEASQAQGAPGFWYAKIPVNEIEKLVQFQRSGFSIIDTNVTLSKAVSRGAKSCFSRLAKPADREAVKEIARSAFTLSRFHLDPEIPREKANEIKAAWADNFFSGKRGSAMIVAERDGIVAGFLQLLGTEGKQMTIDLIAVEQKYRGQGLATDMIAFAEETFKNIETVVVGTQISNTNSIHLYEKSGFTFRSACYVAHLHDKHS